MLSFSVRTRLAKALGPACVGLLMVGAAVGQGAQKPTASQLLQNAFADASARGSVHEVQSEVDGSRRDTASDDVSLHSGRQNITVSDGVHAEVLLVGPVAYISGNQKALVSYFGFPRAVAGRIGTRWVRIPSSNPDYTPVAADATLPSALSEIKPSGHLEELPASELDGRSVIGIRGNLPSGFQGGGTDTIYLTRSTRPLLVSATFAGSGHTITFSFSDWGEHVAANPPRNPIPISQLAD